MAKKQKCPEFENHERWLVAFADMMTLLFALFVVLYSIANVEKSKLAKVSSSIRKAFGYEAGESDGPNGQPSGNANIEGVFEKVKGNTRLNQSGVEAQDRDLIMSIAKEKIEANINKLVLGQMKSKVSTDEKPFIFVTKDHDGIRISLLARHIFAPGQYQLDKEAKSILDGVAQSLKGIDKIIRIEGHTDSLPFNKGDMTNWELSSSRAARVVRYFVENHDFAPESIYAAGFADTRPIAPNNNNENRNLNRRVDLKLLYDQ